MIDINQKNKPKNTRLTLLDFEISEDMHDDIVQVTFFKLSRHVRYTIELYHDTEFNNEIITKENWKYHPVVLWIGEQTVYCPSVELAVEIVNGLEKQ